MNTEKPIPDMPPVPPVREMNFSTQLVLEGDESGVVVPWIKINCGAHFVTMDCGVAIEVGANLIRIAQQGLDESDLSNWLSDGGITGDGGTAQSQRIMLDFFAWRRKMHGEPESSEYSAR